MILVGDCFEHLRGMGDCSVDAVVTDPPYELGFMGKAWDSSGVAYRVDLWGEVLRVLKPGGHLLAFGGSRTYHRLACAVEDAGFEIRDQIMWVYGSGFPKSLDVSKAIDKAAGAEREVVGPGRWNHVKGDNERQREVLIRPGGRHDETAPATDAAKRWSGWGTALKPAHEPVVVARRPLVGTVAQNVLLWGTGAINIDECRVGIGEPIPGGGGYLGGAATRHDGWARPSHDHSTGVSPHTLGRWPANLIHDGSDEVLEHFPDAGGSAARFFYCAKAGRAERNAGLDGLPKLHVDFGGNGRLGAGFNEVTHGKAPSPAQNHHPTVKPVALMRYLVRLVTPPDGVVFDPFLGSGTTAVAAILEGKRWVGCELTEEYVPIIEGRVAWAEANRGML